VDRINADAVRTQAAAHWTFLGGGSSEAETAMRARGMAAVDRAALAGLLASAFSEE
jgi:hypothetical protein